MTDEPKPRRGKTADDRALEGAAARKERERTHAPAFGVPINEFNAADERDFTPVTQVLELVEQGIADETTRAVVADVVRKIWIHTANAEMRIRKMVADAEDVSELRESIDTLDTFKTDLTGASGSNGRFGMLTAKVHETRKAAVWIVTTILAGAIGAVIKLILVGRSYGALENQVDTNTGAIERLERRLDERGSRRHEPPPDAAEKAVTP